MKNNIWTGMVIGLICPLAAYLLIMHTSVPERIFPTKPFIAYLIAAAINLLLVRIFYRKTMPQDKTARGVMLVTFLGMLVFLYFHKLNM